MASTLGLTTDPTPSSDKPRHEHLPNFMMATLSRSRCSSSQSFYSLCSTRVSSMPSTHNKSSSFSLHNSTGFHEVKIGSVIDPQTFWIRSAKKSTTISELEKVKEMCSFSVLGLSLFVLLRTFLPPSFNWPN
jgi:hypothetical protein